MEKVFKTRRINRIFNWTSKRWIYMHCDSLPTFMPASQIDVKPIKKIDHLMNIPIKVIATRIDKNRGNVCTSRRAVLEKNKNAEINAALKKIKEGDIIEDAKVKATTDWGIFLDIFGIPALLHVSDLSYGRVKKPSEMVSIGQKIRVKITKIDPKTHRVSASVKDLTEDPYKNLTKKYEVGKIYDGEVVKIMDYGCFIKLEEGIEGLIHSSELDWTNKNIHPSKVLSNSQKIKVKIVTIDEEAKRISLSYKETLITLGEKLDDLVGKAVDVKIKKITDKAIFAELDSGITGMLHYKELSYNESLEDLKKYKTNDKLKVKLIEIKDDKM